MRQLFIYYRVATVNAVPLAQALRAAQAALQNQYPGLVARTLTRRAGRDEVQTWMEIYSTDPTMRPNGVDPALQRVIETELGALAALIDGTRHCEVFDEEL
jgi:hypothetical protein